MISKLGGALDHLTVSVYVENGAGGNGSSEMSDLVICGYKCVDEVGGADDGKAEGEEQSCEGDERHGEGHQRVDNWKPVEMYWIYVCGRGGSGAKAIALG